MSRESKQQRASRLPYAALLLKEALATLSRLRGAAVRVVIHLDTQPEPGLPWLCRASLVARFS
jgi:hypothetical protein